MTNERLDIPLLLLLMWASFAALAQSAAPAHVIAAVTPSVWTEGVVIALITSITTTVVSLATLFVGVFKLNKIDEKVEIVHKTTNSMKDALVAAALKEGEAQGAANEQARKTASDAVHAQGVKEGRAEVAVAQTSATDANPTPVKVVAAVHVPVVETPNIKPKE